MDVLLSSCLGHNQALDLGNLSALYEPNPLHNPGGIIRNSFFFVCLVVVVLFQHEFLLMNLITFIQNSMMFEAF